MLTKENSAELLKTQTLTAFQFRDKVGEILKNYKEGLLNHFVFDIETKGLNIFQKDCGFIGFSFCDPINKIGYWVGYIHPDIYTPENEKNLILSCLFKLLYNVPVVGHNIIFDLNYMTFQFKLDMKKVVILDDTLFMSYYLFGAKRDTGISLSLKNIFRYFFQIDLVWEDELKKALESHRMIKDRHFFNVPYETIAKYGAYDSIVTYYLRLGLWERLQGRNMTAYNFLIRSIHAFVDLETTGLAVDWEFRDYLRVRYDAKIKEFEEKIQKTSIVQRWKEDTFTEFNLNSSKMIGDILYNSLYYGCPALYKTPKGAPSTNEEALLGLVNSKDPSIPEEAKVFVGELLENRNSVKMVTTYLEPLDERRIGEGQFSPQYNLVGTATGRLCFVGSTQISLLDGTEKRLDELEESSEFYVYSSKLDGTIVPTKARSLGATKKVKELIGVTLDNGKTEKCTPDHKWLLRSGNYCEAQNLKEGDSLMPLYRKDFQGEGRNSGGYTLVLDNFRSNWKSVHTLVNEKYNQLQREESRERIKSKLDRFLITHHKDFNSRNNVPENLEWMGENEHWVYHSNLTKSKWEDLEFRKRFSTFISNLFKTPSYQKFFSEHNRRQVLERWKNPDYIKLMSGYMKKRWESEDFRKLVSKTMKSTIDRLWKDPEFKELQSNKLRVCWEDKEYRKKMTKVNSEASIRLWKNEEHREKMSLVSKETRAKQQNDPNFIEALKKNGKEVMARNRQTEEWRKKDSINGKNSSFNKSKIILEWLEENKLELTEENYNKCPSYKRTYPSFTRTLLYIKDNLLGFYNHKVAKVERIFLEEEVPVYDITILDGPSNFALSSGVFVANSSYFHTLPSGNDIKRMIISKFKEEGGTVVASDFSQLEVRTIAGLAGDPILTEAYRNGYDVHSYIASQMFNTPPEMISKIQRRQAKIVVFGILYGKHSYSLSSELEISKEEAQKLIDFFFVGFKKIKQFIDYQHKFLKVNKYVTTPFGRTRYLKDIDSPEWKKVAEAQRAAQNTPIQSVASDLAFDSALRIYYALRDGNMKSKFIGTVHDSILVDSHPDEIHQVLSLMRYHMNDYINETYTFLNGCPIKSDFEVGTSWGGSCALDNFSEKVWSCSGYRLDAENLVERIKIFQDVKHSNFIEYEQNEDKIQKFVDAGKKVKFKIVW